MLILDGSFSLEKEAHELFKKQHIRGEWFRYDGFLKDCLIACSDENTINVSDIRTLQPAGLSLRCRRAANRKARNGDNTMKKRIRAYKL